MKTNKTICNSSLAGLFCSIALIGCSESDRQSSSPASVTNTRTNTSSTTFDAATNKTNDVNTNADNSGINVRDRDTNNLTAFDQGNSAADIELTQRIRAELVGSTNLSMPAKNIKIISNNGLVTLRGPVNSADEKSSIEATAKNIAGDSKVDNQLEIKSNP